jgi:hypothetical protein
MHPHRDPKARDTKSTWNTTGIRCLDTGFRIRGRRHHHDVTDMLHKTGNAGRTRIG